jgi:hypothetical protein
MVSELIEWADSDALDLMSTRRVEQEVLDGHGDDLIPLAVRSLNSSTRNFPFLLEYIAGFYKGFRK